MSTLASVTAQPYSSRACKGSALFAETKVLLRAWSPGEGAAVLERRASGLDLLGKATARRVHDIVHQVFAYRYLRDDGRPARWMKRLLELEVGGNWFAELCLLYTGRADVVLRDSATVLLRRATDEGRTRVDADQLVAFLTEAERDGRMSAPWSDSVRLRVAQGMLRQLTEFGLLGDNRRGSREMLPFRPSRFSAAFLAHELHFGGCSDGGLVTHRDWQLWQLTPEEVRHELDELSREGLWVFQSAGSLVRIAWTYETMEETVDALARLDL